MTFSDVEKEFGPDNADDLRRALRAGGLPRLLSWLYLKEFRTPVALFRDLPNASPADIALSRDGEATGARKVLDFLSSVIGEEVALPTPPFRKLKG